MIPDYFALALEILKRGELVTGTEYQRIMGGMYAQAIPDLYLAECETRAYEAGANSVCEER